ncbi:hypothetical protein P9J83_01395 [Clostridium sporogenes]|uniref:Uncharacterized protein n=1 Tax=Clostridium sporogenes TaxID=1509 RepID=A0AAE4FGM4_CLOSG|nr:hypothetical protein [Clostridium sporogenes]MDS1002158.1 hypothetical protein [Clostridium sporogenes]
MSKIYNFLKYEIERNYSIKKYIVVMILYTFIVINETNIINSYGNNNIQFNAWDIIFSVLSEPKNIVISLIFTYIILINNIIVDSNFEKEMILKLGSRRVWWNIKVCILFLKASICILSLTILTIIASIKFEFSKVWSYGFSQVEKISAKNNLFYSSPLNEDIYQQSPLFSFAETILLLLLGLIAIGLFVMVITLLFNNKIVSIISGFAVLIIAAIPAFEMESSIITDIIYNHILINTHSFNNINSSFTSVGYSISHWILYILILYYIGYKLSLKKNFISKEHS